MKAAPLSQAQYLDLHAAAPLMEAGIRRLSTWFLSPPSHPWFYVSPAPAPSSFGSLIFFAYKRSRYNLCKFLMSPTYFHILFDICTYFVHLESLKEYKLNIQAKSVLWVSIWRFRPLAPGGSSVGPVVGASPTPLRLPLTKYFFPLFRGWYVFLDLQSTGYARRKISEMLCSREWHACVLGRRRGEEGGRPETRPWAADEAHASLQR